MNRRQRSEVRLDRNYLDYLGRYKWVLQLDCGAYDSEEQS